MFTYHTSFESQCFCASKFVWLYYPTFIRKK